ncbi:hypothetical protein FK268_11345 [Tsukamurella sputi]|uniref:Toxin-antitoxin system HicB family antitoxin n=1 Tax=Tsukamurella sputi TaxID=2591848 RepID=A0A5C5RNM1_9ACTN|nr:hypothetical protein [Tsukamurella sputi]TWS24194.1 hypothetical protein FK268_11345 [Tsukamurella sputi]
MSTVDTPEPSGDRPERGRKAVPLRIDPEVYRALAKWAADDLRSVNAQIEVLLRRALDDAGRMPAKARPMRGPGRPPGSTDSS